jgi:MinD-like ATPase involved in chromosome partitioning or flagellar assembly
MRTITFYSYKGGVGRSLALANIAIRLTEFNKKICLIDFDLEAPGLHLKFPLETESIDITKGLVDYIYEYSNNGILPKSISDYCIEYTLTNKKSFHFLPAGNINSSNYWKKLSSINWFELMFENKGGLRFFIDLKTKIKNEINPDFLLIDSRTGVSEMSGITLSLLGDEIVIVAANNKENLDGAKRIIKSLKTSHNLITNKWPAIQFVLSRIPFTDEPQDRAKEQRLLENISSEFKDVYEGEIVILHSDRELEEREQLKIGKDSDETITSISNDYLKLFGILTKSSLSPDEIEMFQNIKEGEKLFRKLQFTNNDKEKLDLINKAIGYNKQNIEYLLYRTRILNRLKEFDKASEDLLRIIALDNKHTEAHILLARNYLSQKNYKEAEYYCDRLLKFHNNSDALYLKGLIAGRLNQRELEMSFYLRALEVNPNNPLIYNKLALYYLDNDNLQLAVETLFKSLELNPKIGLTYIILAEIRSRQKNINEFYFYLEQALLYKNLEVIKRITTEEIFKEYHSQDRFIKLMEKYNIIL